MAINEAGSPPPEPHSQLSEIQALQERVAALSRENVKDAQAIGQMGAAIDPSALMQVRLNTFIDFIFSRLGNTSPEVRQLLSLGFEEQFEQRIHEVLDDVKGQVRRAQLSAGGQLDKDQLAQLARVQGMFNGDKKRKS